MTIEEAKITIECLITDMVGAYASEEMPKGVKNTYEALEKAEEALKYVQEMQEFALNTDDDFYGEVLCRKLKKHGFMECKDGMYEVKV